jgi:hypothetical protein
MIPPSSCLATRPQTDCNPKSTNWLAHTLQGDAGRCSMQGSSIGRTCSQLHSTDELMPFMAHRGPVQTKYLFASPVWLTTELISDMASMAMMPLMARFVWLLTVKPSAEDLRYRLLSVIGSLAAHRNNLLIMNVQR